ncbi:PQQ-dependent sugar dehydrogenase [Marinivivus vitaminiproducens]|uniref:PQQ-dependent sugar dehydrogenase n=1 Tax=Marinivivus vitaminiproducens TaxID=3035935 RepID=UPI0027A8D27B|nr:PQQ-dependent sugar dehydrogenase [Geminicoccaceae bacterium SCSIO 64248]
MPRIVSLLLGLSVATLAGCGAASTSGRAQTASAAAVEQVVLADGLDQPWGLAFLPDGGMLITEVTGQIRLWTPEGLVEAPLAGVPEVYARGQGGLLDIALHPGFAANRLVYISYAAPREEGATTKVARGRLSDDRSALEDLEVVFEAGPPLSGGSHFGSRVRFGPDGLLYVTVGERNQRDNAQTLGNDWGKVHRMRDDGTAPEDNPFVGREDARPTIYTWGNRNAQGLAVHPETGAIWLHEHGPRGGDEVNIVQAGQNYGWPVVTFGREYYGPAISDATSAPGMVDPLHVWVPSIAPSGMAFYEGDAFPDWRGDILLGALTGQALVVLSVEGETIVGEERLFEGEIGRVREVKLGPDGLVYLLTDSSDGQLIRLEPAG